MNDRIKELIKQAADQTSAAFSSSNFRQSEWESDFREKFAELIIRECAELCYERKLTPSAFTGDELLEHFEIK